MLWYSVWIVLIVGTLAGAVWMGLWLYRKVKRFLSQLQETTVVLERLDQRMDELTESRGPEPVFTADLLASAAERAGWRGRLDQNRARRAGRKRRRRQATLDQWRMGGRGPSLLGPMDPTV